MSFLIAGVLLLCVGSLGASVPEKHQKVLADTLSAVQTATAINQGQGEHVIYIFIDPDCPYCRLLYSDLKPLIGPYHLEVRWLLVGIIDKTSFGRAAAILDAKDPRAALDYNEMHFNMETRAGGMAEKTPSKGAESQLHHNERLLRQTGIPSVPTMLFTMKSGAPFLLRGAPTPVLLRDVLARVR